MKSLIIYYSFEGGTRLIAETMVKKLEADLLELKPEKEIKTRGFLKYFWGGRQVMMKIAPKLLPLGKNPDDYELIIIGTPVWAFNYAPPLRTFFSQIKLANKRLALFCVHEGNFGKTLENMKQELKGNDILSETDFIDVAKNPEANIKKAGEWLEKIL